MSWLKPLAALLILLVAAVAGALATSGAPLMTSPGLFPRVFTYLTENRVNTQLLSAFPERELTTYRRPPEAVLDAAVAVARARGWAIRRLDREAKTLHAVASTPVWGFRDDVTVTVTTTETGASALHITSASRIGRGDLGANTARLIALRQGIEARL